MTDPDLADPRLLRQALYHRLHLLLPLVAHPLARRVWRVLVWGVVLLWFAFAGLILTLRYSVLPNIERYRPAIEQAVGRGIGLPVQIGGIAAGWDGLRPDLVLSDVRVGDAEGRPALAFSRVEAILDWSSLAFYQLRLALLAIDEPVLHFRRDAAGKLFVAGLPVDEASSDASVGDWVLAQRRIRINGATLVWEDEKRAAPPLILEDVNLAIDNDGRRHRFGLTALPPAELAARIDLRGDLAGDDLNALDDWEGKLFAELDYVDLAGWRQWVDYPVALPRGRGAMRAWLAVDEGRLLDLTADLALDDVRLQLARALPELRLSSLHGRLGARLRQGGFSANARQLALALADGTVVPPTDFSFDWQSAGDGRPLQGSGTASRIDLQRLNHLSRYLPLDANTRKLLDEHAPSGEVSDLRVSFSGDAERLAKYSLRARFERLGLAAKGYFPGFHGISGSVGASEKGGAISLRSQASGLDLPSVFPEPRLAFDELDAELRWKVAGDVLEVDLQRIAFAGADAAGSARGSYRYDGRGPGVIDLTAALSRARGDAVWRYMPHAVNADARAWLRRGIAAGNASDAKLTLKGDLARFPFIDGSGTFVVTAKAHDVTIDYADGWPKLEHVAGKMRFAGAGMRVDAESGAIFGTKIAATVAEIDDFDSLTPLLTVRGKVEGPTADFFRFIEASPLGETLEHPVSDMTAVGNGKLDLDLRIPLANVDDTRVAGDFRFLDNQLTLDPALPPLTGVGGLLHFTDSAISVREITAQFLGGPVKVRAETRNGVVDVVATGTLSVAQARRQYPLALFDRLSGATQWRTLVKVRKGSAEIAVDSSLAGISSALPAPFNKTATDALPLRFEKGAAARGGGDRIALTLGRDVALQLTRRRDAGNRLLPERGVLAVGAVKGAPAEEATALPERGFALVVALPEVDVDFWRSALRSDAPRSDAQASSGDLPLPDSVRVSSAALKAFGRTLHNADVQARLAAGVWQVQLAAREANGEIRYDPFGRGALRARLKNLALDAGDKAADAPTAAAASDDLPALDVVAENFAIGPRQLGRLELQARNEASDWRIDRLAIVNPDARLDGSGVWHMQPARRFVIDFKLDSDDLGGLLGRLGFPGTVRRGSGMLAGELAWNGVPYDIDYPSLAGKLAIEASSGQFAKIEPGGAGRLLGLISLQGLPRRITLDFRDVFSEGFAFDNIAGKLDVKAGVMHTERLQIDGPSARVLMRGNVDLKEETQRLVVNVQPELGGTAALGVAVVNPIAGAAALLAHKVLRNPLNQIFSFDYGISGTWDDPKVEKLSTQRLGAQFATDGENKDARQQ